MQQYAYSKQIPATTITGSIVGYWANAETTITTYVMGDHSNITGLAIATDPGATVVSTTALTVPAGSYLEGNFIALDTNAVGIVYYNGTLTQTDA
jgi:hypothetical protein